MDIQDDNIPDLQNCEISDYDSEYTKQSVSSVDYYDDSMNIEMWDSLEERLNTGEPYLKIIEQPVGKFRFRYKSEMQGTHGCLTAGTRKSEKPKFPTVELCNFNRAAIISCILYTEDCKMIHAHSLMKGNETDPHFVSVNPEHGYRAVFADMGIIHTARKNLSEELQQKMKRISNEPYHSDTSFRESQNSKSLSKEIVKNMKLNVVKLCFEAFEKDQFGNLNPITKKVFSKPINNKKSAQTGELKICRVNLVAGSCRGGEEMILFVEKVMKKNINVRFFEINDDDMEVWEAFGKFSEMDVHHQYAIVLKTPPYKDLNIKKPVNVYVELYRPSDRDRSEPKWFQYLPVQPTIGIKRPRLELSDSFNLSGSLVNNGGDVLHCLDQINKDIDSDEFQKLLSKYDWEEYGALQQQEKVICKDGAGSRQIDAKSEHKLLENIITELKIQRKSHATIQPLIEKICSVGINDNNSPLHLAINSDITILKTLLEILCHSPQASKSLIEKDLNHYGENILHRAIKLNLSDVTKLLIQTLNINPNLQDFESYTALHTIFRLDEINCLNHLKELLMSKYPLIPNVKNKEDLTPLQLAVKKEYISAIKLLIKIDDPYFPRTSDGCNSLHLSVMKNSYEATKIILEFNSTGINMKNDLGYTPLFYAAVQKNENLCKLLMDYEADPHVTNSVDDLLTSESSDSEDDEEDKRERTILQFAQNEKNIIDILTKVEKNKVENVEIETKFDSQCLAELGQIFDKNNKWKILTHAFGLDVFINILKQTESPTIALLNHPELNLSVDEIQNYFSTANILEAEESIKNMKKRINN